MAECTPKPESKLGSQRKYFYGDEVIRFLRFAGMLNVAIWLGAAFFFAAGVTPQVSSEAVQKVMAAPSFGYHFNEVWQFTLARLFYLQITCAILAMLHLVAEWLYLGRTLKNLWRVLLYALFVLSLTGGIWLAPKLRELNRVQHSPTVRPEERQAAAKAYDKWHGIFQSVNVLMMVGLAAYFWRTVNPPDELKFVGSPKFRG